MSLFRKCFIPIFVVLVNIASGITICQGQTVSASDVAPTMAAQQQASVLTTFPALDLFPARLQQGSAETQDPATVNVPVAASSGIPLAPLPGEGFFDRWGRAYLSDWTGNSPVTEVPQLPRRGTPAPIPSPPYPASDWPIGGTPVIGAPDTQSYPLMQAINGNTGRNKIYGWLEVGGNGSTNNKTNAQKGIAASAPAAYDVYSNQIQLDQAALYFSKLEDTVQTDHFDWGYQLTLLYGVDYRFTTSHGILSQQLLVKNAEYGFDPVMFYVDGYFPHLGKGSVLRVGRYISLPDIEAQLAPNNYTYSHSILYTYDCYTMVGANLTTKIDDHWTVQGGISPGCDTAPWTTDAKLTGNVCVIYTWSNGGNALNTCDNTINDGKYAYNNLTAYYETFYHRINAHWHTATEGWYQYMKQTPNMYWYNSGGMYGKSSATPFPETNGAGGALNFGAVCEDPRLPAAQQAARCYAPEWAITNYLEHNFWNNRASLNIRNEFVDDIKGQRTGTPAKYEEHLVGVDLWTGSTVTFRPELSYMKCYSTYKSLDGRPVSCTDISAGSSIASDEATWLNGPGGAMPTGLGKTQYLTLAADIIWHF
ncbi:MAG: outer membrane beta-barrel protein [Acidobacteria bacterium]|nr:outer membrane beta-barrel protein [Acidobacteriota bacterium]